MLQAVGVLLACIDRSYTAHSLSNVDYGETTVALSRPSVCYWYKQDLKSFLIAALGGTGLINRVNWDQPKRQIVSDLVEMLCADQDRYLDELRILLKAVSEFRDFHHLERLEDGSRKAREAREAVRRLRTSFRRITNSSKSNGRSSSTAKRKPLARTPEKLSLPG